MRGLVCGSRTLSTPYVRKTPTLVLANLEHVVWLFGHPVWLGLADGKHVIHLSIFRRGRERYTNSVVGRPLDGLAGATGDWLLQ